MLKKLGKELEKVNIAKSIAEATYSRIRNQIRAISYELLPQRIDQRIIQTLASRGGELAIKDLSLILNLTEEILAVRLELLEKHNLISIVNDQIYLS